MSISNPAREYAEECFLDAIHHAVTRNPGMTYEDVLAGAYGALRQAPEAYENAQPDPNAHREDRALRVRHMALS